MGKVCLSLSLWIFSCLEVFCSWHDSMSLKLCMSHHLLVFQAFEPFIWISFILWSEGGPPSLFISSMFVSRSVIRALDALYYVLHFVVLVCHLFFCESSGLFGFNSFSKLGFFRVFCLIGWSWLFWVLYTSFYLLYVLIIQTRSKIFI